MKAWGATKTGVGEARTDDAAKVADFVNRFDHTFASAVSYKGLGEEPRAQVAASPTGTRFTTSARSAAT